MKLLLDGHPLHPQLMVIEALEAETYKPDPAVMMSHPDQYVCKDERRKLCLSAIDGVVGEKK